MRVWAAVLADAIAALQGTHADARATQWRDGKDHPLMSREQLWREACEWVMSRATEPLGTFESVCGILGLYSGEVRRELCALAVQHRPMLNDATLLECVV